MKRWPTKPLGELLKVQNGFAFKSELFNEDGKGLPIIRIRDLARGYSETFYDGKHDSVFEVENGDFLIGMDGEFRCYRWQGGKALLNQRVCRLQNFSRDLNAGYVFYGINEHLRQIEDNTSFVTVKHLSSKQIANIEMPVPPLAEQERIVKLLDEADELRKLRVQADRRSAALIPALFHEMFGESKGKVWPIEKLSEFAEVKSGAGFPLDRQGLLDQSIPFLKVGDMNTTGNESEMHIFQHSISETTRSELGATLLPAGCVIFPKVGAAIGTNKKRILVCPSCVDNNVMAIIPSQNLTTEFMFAQLATKNLSEFASNSNPPSIRKTTVEDWQIPVPPLPLQKEFAQRVSEIRELQAAQAASRERTEHLFQSMLHRAFNQEL